MLTALALTLRLLLAAEGDCYFVGNTRILRLPSCDVGPATIAELTEDPTPATAASLRRRSAGPVTGRRNQGPVRAPAATVVMRGNEELERRLELAERERVDAVTRRLAAEQRRDAAVAARAEAVRALEEARRSLAAAEARLARCGAAARAEEGGAPGHRPSGR